MGKRDKNTITLGSGYVYAMVYTGTMPDEKPFAPRTTDWATSRAALL